MDRGAQRASAHGVIESDTTERLHARAHTHTTMEESDSHSVPRPAPARIVECMVKNWRG